MMKKKSLVYLFINDLDEVAKLETKKSSRQNGSLSYFYFSIWLESQGFMLKSIFISDHFRLS